MLQIWLIHWLRYACLFAYLFVMIISRLNPLHVPISFIAAGVTLLSTFQSSVTNYIFNWSLYSLLVYMLITYHEHDGCLLETCYQSETSALVSVIATIVAWTTITERSKPKVVKKSKPKVINAPVIKPLRKLKVVKKEPTFPKLQWV